MTSAVAPPSPVEAELFHGKLATGRNRPVRITARGAEGPVDCVVKLSSAMNPPETAVISYLCEWLGTAIARLLGIPTPRPYEVAITQPFADAIVDPEWRELARRSIGSAFGSEHVGGAGSITQWTPELPSHELCLPACDLIGFDVFIQNVDRRAGNPNLFVRRKELIAYDHGEAFAFLWDFRGPFSSVEDPMFEMLEQHALRGWVHGYQASLERFRENLELLTDELLDSVIEATPKRWQVGIASGKLEQVVEFLKRRRDAAGKWLPQVEAWLQR